MNLYHLRYFSTLAHIEHYTKAADILAITQPSLSYAISTLEEELGVKLFEKNGRNVTLTKYGKVFLNDVEEVLNRLDSSVNSLKLAGKGEGCIDVVFLRTLGIDFLPKIMRGFLEENPTKKIDFNLYCDKVLTSDILNGLKEKKAVPSVQFMRWKTGWDLKMWYVWRHTIFPTSVVLNRLGLW